MIGPELQVEDFLPHRQPFLFVDRIIALEGGRSADGLFEINAAHPLMNHTGERPIFPSLLLVEALGQVAALVIRMRPVVTSGDRRPQGFLVRVDHCRFDRAVYAGETLILSARLLASYGPLHKFDARGEVAGEPVVQASITLYLNAVDLRSDTERG
jgi:3-hydroxyacyl-[acyl-carrier-protein] dehydratase